MVERAVSLREATLYGKAAAAREACVNAPAASAVRPRAQKAYDTPSCSTGEIRRSRPSSSELCEPMKARPSLTPPLGCSDTTPTSALKLQPPGAVSPV